MFLCMSVKVYAVSVSVTYWLIFTLPWFKVLDILDRCGVQHPEQSLCPGDKVDIFLVLDPVQPLLQCLPLLPGGEPVGVHGKRVRGSVCGVVSLKVFLQPVQNILFSHVSEHTLINIGTMTSKVTLKDEIGADTTWLMVKLCVQIVHHIITHVILKFGMGLNFDNLPLQNES